MDQAEIAAYRELHQNIVEASQDRDTFKLATLHLFDNLIVNQRYGDGVYEEKSDSKELSRYEIACHHLNGNIDMIYDYAESPIERLFLCSLLMVSMRFSPFMIAITTPIVADVFPAKIFTLHKRNLDNRREFRKDPSIVHIAETFQILEELEPAVYSILPKHLDAMGRGLVNNMGYLLNGLVFSIHVSLQPTFEKVRVEGKAIRPDMMLWVPIRPDFKLIVECDGYQYHSD
jgi:hypothetical protein